MPQLGQLNQAVLRRGLRDGGHTPAPLPELLKQLRHLPFQIMPVVEHDIRVSERRGVARRRLIQVRIDPRTHQCRHLNPIPADALCQIAHHPGRRGDRNLPPAPARIGTASASRA